MPLANFTTGEKALGFGIGVPSGLHTVAQDAYGHIYGFVMQNGVSDPQGGVREIVEFSESALIQGAKEGAESMRRHIANGSVGDNEYTRSFTTPDGYLEREGIQNTLANWLFDQEGAELQQFTVSVDDMYIFLYGFALSRIDQAISAHVSGDANESLVQMAIAGSSLVDAAFHDGYVSAERQAAADRKNSARERGLKSGEPYRILEAWVIEQYHAGHFKSPHAASFELLAPAQEKATALGIRLSPTRGRQTIYEYLLKAK